VGGADGAPEHRRDADHDHDPPTMRHIAHLLTGLSCMEYLSYRAAGRAIALAPRAGPWHHAR
jgi:hypothetical protein